MHLPGRLPESGAGTDDEARVARCARQMLGPAVIDDLDRRRDDNVVAVEIAVDVADVDIRAEAAKCRVEEGELLPVAPALGMRLEVRDPEALVVVQQGNPRRYGVERRAGDLEIGDLDTAAIPRLVMPQ